MNVISKRLTDVLTQRFDAVRYADVSPRAESFGMIHTQM
jgi:hypothetical protein